MSCNRNEALQNVLYTYNSKFSVKFRPIIFIQLIMYCVKKNVIFVLTRKGNRNCRETNNEKYFEMSFEVEVDIITGEMFVVRTDILEDAGLSTSPIVDIGQVEGAFVMGLGLFTSEEIKHDRETGELLTKNTWEYKPPAAKDIPQDFRVTLLKNARNPLGVMSSKGQSISSA